ncbi:hypothetical protein EJ05DRAFT_498848 [Pseudovirgaria hyperparasitica]|uniref:DUF7702 domain-containing protein n=1 Tax=Pseudovirgaria hyperparasitica TaxID=470096 RepID=A0A6A6WDK3_9PEZI|nr:uncharacterized protein EJ05DRAFT_498848 [Pseudovirgaria hyperparasitica]KAF2759637.1 hypothetical protein EJ05DRAFT_498848 [Pseudovirgaria hyperparasitica]
MVSYREGVAILQIIFYFLCVPLALFLCKRHGFAKSSGWYFLILFVLFRLTAGICTLIYTQAVGNGDGTTATNAVTGAIVCNSTGLSPLNLILLGLLSRVNDHIAEGTGKVPPRVFKLIGLVSLVGLILSSSGGSSSTYHDDGSVTIATTSKAALIMFFIIFIVQVFLTIYFQTRSRAIDKGEKRLVLAVAICSPFLIIRYAYQFEYTFTGKRKWSSTFGDVTLFLILFVLTEIIVVTTCIAVGLTLRKRPATAQTHDELAESGASADEVETSRRQAQIKRRKARGPISWLYYTIQESVKNNSKSSQQPHQVEGYSHK